MHDESRIMRPSEIGMIENSSHRWTIVRSRSETTCSGLSLRPAATFGWGLRMVVQDFVLHIW